jgi:hypothetical protein
MNMIVLYHIVNIFTPKSLQSSQRPLVLLAIVQRNGDLVGVNTLALNKCGQVPRDLPSGNLLHSYWKLPFIVVFPIKNGDFP